MAAVAGWAWLVAQRTVIRVGEYRVRLVSGVAVMIGCGTRGGSRVRRPGWQLCLGAMAGDFAQGTGSIYRASASLASARESLR
jgi:hypothetical protein